MRAAIATAAFAVTTVFAQSYAEDDPMTSMSSSDSVSYTTVTYDDCPSSMLATMITVTHGETITYCPECEHMSTTSTPTPGYTTIYTTTYLSLCPTGTVPVTYTVTESCTDATPTWTPGPSHIPQGFTVTTKSCSACGASSMPMTVTVTEPCGCEAHEGSTVNPPATAPAPAAKTSAAKTTVTSHGGAPVTEKSDGQPEVPVATSPAPPGSASAPSSSEPACDGECGGEANGNTSPGTSARPAPAGTYPAAAAPSPSAMTTTESCPGPACQATTSSMAPSGTLAAEPPVNAAAHPGSVGLLFSFAAAAVVAVLAFML